MATRLVTVPQPTETTIAEGNPQGYLSMEAELLRTAASREQFGEFKTILTDKVMLPEAKMVLADMGAWYEANPKEDTINWSSFLAWARITTRTTLKADKWAVYEATVKHAASLLHPNPAIINRYAELKGLSEIRQVIDSAVSSYKPSAMADIAGIVDRVQAKAKAKASPDLVTSDLRQLMDAVQRNKGLKWRLGALNVSVGPVDRGDFIIIGKRPEVGGTTFLADQLSYMVTQLPPDKNGIIFTNEEVGSKVKVRVIQAALGWTMAEMAADLDKTSDAYEKVLGGRRIDIVHNTALTDRDVERWLRNGDYGVIGINVLDKIHLTSSDNEGVDLKRDLGIWARGVADRYGVVIGVLQAGAEAEGVLFPGADCLYGSKTGLQAESDVMIMIGKTSNPSEAAMRGIGIVRNKLPGGNGTDPRKRYGQWHVDFDGERSRYIDKPGSGV